MIFSLILISVKPYANILYFIAGEKLMSGHSKWANIKRRKEGQDKKKAKVFGKVTREIMVAVRMSGSDPNFNPRLRSALDAARSSGLPKSNIDYAIKKGSGELQGEMYEELMFEGYGPGNMAVMLSVMTDNKKRTVPEIRHAFDKRGGNLAVNGSVAWMFEKKGYFIVLKSSAPEEKVFEVAMENNAEDFSEQEEVFEIYCQPENFNALSQAFQQNSIIVEYSELGMLPKNEIDVEPEHLEKAAALVEDLEDLDDVQNVWTNCSFPDSESD